MKRKKKALKVGPINSGEVWDKLDPRTRRYVVIKSVRSRCTEDKVKAAAEFCLLNALQVEQINPCAWRQISAYLSFPENAM